jgi:hypothetical protein
MKICKHYVNNKCTNDNCKFQHIDNICRNYFFRECNNPNCKFDHNYKLKELQNKTKKNTESFEPILEAPDLIVKVNDSIKGGNEVCIVKNIIWRENIFKNLLNEIDSNVYKLWHGDSHYIADDSLNWKQNSESFNYVINTLCEYFDMTASATRFNLYNDSKEWKPYHHDAAAFKPDKAKKQNITIGVSFGLTREISFQHAKSYNRINFPLENGSVYVFGNQVNIDYRHGIPQLKNYVSEKRISIIIWGYSQYI